MNPVILVALLVGQTPGQAPTPTGNQSTPVETIQSYQERVNSIINHEAPNKLGARTLSSTKSRISSPAVDQNAQKRISLTSDWKRLHEEDYSAVMTKSFFKPTRVRVQGNRAVVEGTESFEMDLVIKDKGPQEFSPEKQAFMEELESEGHLYKPGGTVPSSIAIHHRYQLTLRKSGWVIDSDVSDDPALVQPEIQLDVSKAVGPPSKNEVLLNATTLISNTCFEVGQKYCGVTYFGVNRKGAASYADRWCNEGASKGKGYNRAYSDYGSNNTDCANFVSQCLADSRGGQLPTDSTWKKDSDTWKRAGGIIWPYNNGVFNYWSSRVAFKPIDRESWSVANEYQRKYLYFADLICYYSDKHHVAIIVACDSNGNCYYDAHTIDRFHNLWDAFSGKSEKYSMLHMN